MALAGLVCATAVVTFAISTRFAVHRSFAATVPPASGMVWVPGGEFTMGTNSAMSMRN